MVRPIRRAKRGMESHTHESSSSSGCADRLDSNGQNENPTQAFYDLSDRLRELKSYVGYFLSAKSDSLKLSLRNAGLYAVLGVVGLLVAGTIVVMAAALLCLGIAYGLAVLFGDKVWLGFLVTGAALLALIGGVVFAGMKYLTNSWRRRTVAKYDKWLNEQRLNLGTDVRQSARRD